MPHLTLEHTANLTNTICYAALFKALHQILAETADVDLNNCKSRAVPLAHYRVGDGDARHAFAHLEIRLFDRPPAVKTELGERSLACLRRHLTHPTPDLTLQLTVEIVDVERAAYFKELHTSTSSGRSSPPNAEGSP
jgi:5-carboxymethyl-2-hydroxymuconate isomerase